MRVTFERFRPIIGGLLLGLCLSSVPTYSFAQEEPADDKTPAKVDPAATAEKLTTASEALRLKDYDEARLILDSFDLSELEQNELARLERLYLDLYEALKSDSASRSTVRDGSITPELRFEPYYRSDAPKKQGIEPVYPPDAKEQGIEGWVVVQFTIDASGKVKDATVVEAQPQGVFEQAAIDAVSRWKYDPPVEGGQSVERRGVRIVLSFKIDE